MIQELLGSPVVILLMVSGLGIVLIGIVYFLIPSDTQSRLENFVGDPEESAGDRSRSSQDSLSQARSQLNNALVILGSDNLRMQLASAHWRISDTEFILIRAVFTFLGFVIGWLVPRTLIGGIGLAAVAYILPGIVLSRSIDLRQHKFQAQLLDALVLIKGAVQSGYSLMQALDLVRQEMVAPASEEFGRVIREVQLGLPTNQALLNLSSRMQSDDLYMVVTSININSQVGGNLSVMLGAVTDTIRARIYLFSEVRALTSYARYASYFLSLLPFITALIILFVNPSYFSKVPQSLISQFILIVAFIALLVGNFWLRRIARIKV